MSEKIQRDKTRASLGGMGKSEIEGLDSEYSNTFRSSLQENDRLGDEERENDGRA